jgi:hypothetical protein
LDQTALKTQALMDYVSSMPWIPQEGPQQEAFLSRADVVLYGGAAGGGKTDLAIGLALLAHQETLFIRREAKQLGAVLDRVGQLVDPGRKGWSGQDGRWLLPPWDGVRRQMVIGSTPALGDENKYQGRPRDLLVIDEAANMLEAQVRFLMGWVRSTSPGQRCRTLLCTNPPTSEDGYWLTEMFAAWLDRNHPNPAAPGELRWYAMVDGKEIEVANGDKFTHAGEEVIPQSRTFIPAKLDDNAYLRDTGYRATLQALPEPLRSQMLYGDFTAGRTDDEYQVIPSAWVQEAMDRWQEREFVAERIQITGCDPSRGGKDETIVAYRERNYFHPLRVWPGYEMPDGNAVASKVIEEVGASRCPIHVDVIGIGAAVVDALEMVLPRRVVPVNASSKTEAKDWAGVLTFANKRAELWWNMRDLLNPANGQQIALPPDSKLRSELCSPRYLLRPNGIQVESKQEIKKRLGRSTDRADAVILAAERVPLMSVTMPGQSRIRLKGASRGQ